MNYSNVLKLLNSEVEKIVTELKIHNSKELIKRKENLILQLDGYKKEKNTILILSLKLFAYPIKRLKRLLQNLGLLKITSLTIN